MQENVLAKRVGAEKVPCDARPLQAMGKVLEISFMRKILAEFGPVRKAAIEDPAWVSGLLQLQQLLPGASWAPVSEILAPLRMVKDEDEIDVMRRASHLADQVLDAVMPHSKWV